MKFFLFLIFLFGSLPLYSISPQDDIEVVKELISATEKNLDEQKKIYKYLIEFQKVRSAFIEDPASAKLATKLVRSSEKLKKQIEEAHLEYLFTTDLLTEVQFFTKVGQIQKFTRE